MIRMATPQDVPRVVELGFQEYMEERTFMTGLNFSFMSSFADTIKLLQNPSSGHLIVAEDPVNDVVTVVGFYSCLYAPSMLDNSQLVCRETAWFVCPTHRGRGLGRALKRETVKLALANGCRFMQIGSAVTTETGRSLMEWYKRDGYVPFQMEAFKQITQEDTER